MAKRKKRTMHLKSASKKGLKHMLHKGGKKSKRGGKRSKKR